jgi:type I restriction enzyme S subunit
MKKYDNYKPSGFEWLGEIPEHWEVKRVKDVVVKIGSGVTPLGGSEVYVDKGIPFIRSQNVYDDGLRLDDISFITIEVHQKMKSSQLKPNDILINITGASIGRTCIVPANIKTANINQHIIYLRLKSKYVEYVANYFKTSSVKGYINLIQAGTSKEALNLGQTLNTTILLPSLQEQAAITTYLDRKTQATDKKVALLTQKAAYYKELRKAFINRAVTEGIAENMEMKDSGVEWIRKIPRHWEMRRLKDLGYLYSGLSGKAGDDFNQEDNPNNKGFIPFTNIANNTYLKKDHLGAVLIFEKEKQNKVKKGDIFFLMSSEGHEDIGKTAVLDDEIKETYLNSFCKGFRLTKKFCYPNFINYLLLSTNYRSQFIVEGKGFTRINLKMEKVTDFSVFLPPTLQEQIAIATYLDEKTSVIDAIVANIEKQVVTLKELRKTLINEVVTGKVKITND